MSISSHRPIGMTESELEDIALTSSSNSLKRAPPRWQPSSASWSWRDFFHFCGPGWFVSIAYVDPGNYQADIQAGAMNGYKLLWTLLWTSILSVYVQVLCVRLAVVGQVTLAEVQAWELRNKPYARYINWFLAEVSAVLTDLPEVIGIGIAGNVFFGWPYYIGVLLSLFTTMLFLATLRWGLQKLEVTVLVFVAIMSIALFVEMAFVDVNVPALLKGATVDIFATERDNLFAVTGILGAVVMPHNLYLHTASCQSRRVERTTSTIRQAVRYCAWEPVLPIMISIAVNMAIVAIAAETVAEHADKPDEVGLTDFCQYFQTLRGGCTLWGVALLAAGQSSAITTTFTGQYVMDGFLELRIPVWQRAVVTRLVAIFPCVLVSLAVPSPAALNQVVNIVNSSLSVLLPFALTPLVKYTASVEYMGEDFCAGPRERGVMYGLALAVYLVNALSLFLPGAGFFGNFVYDLPRGTFQQIFWIIVMMAVEVFYAGWIWWCIRSPVCSPMRSVTEERPYVPGEFADAGVPMSPTEGNESVQELVPVNNGEVT